MEKVFQTVEEMIADEGFQSWYLKANAKSITNWENWMKANPSQSAMVQEAVMCMQIIVLEQQQISGQQVESAYESLMLNLPKSKGGKVVPTSSIGRGRSWAAADRR